MKSVVVDTNVIVVANEAADHADDNCIAECITALHKAQTKQRIVIDAGGLFFDEYFRHANRSDQHRVCDAFVKWLWDNQANLKRCESVFVTMRDNNPNDFEEFPDDPALNGFDPSDKKIVAVALASRYNPDILNAVDTDWWEFNDQLRNHGISVKFICRNLMNR